MTPREDRFPAAVEPGGEAHSETAAPAESPVASTAPNDPLGEVRASVREQIEAAWHIHIDQVEQELTKGRAQIDAVLEEQLSVLPAVVESLVQRRAAVLVEGAREAASRAASEKLSQAVRHVWLANNPAEWSGALADAAAKFCGAVAVFRLVGDRVRLERVHGLPATPLEVPLEKAPAFRQAVESREPTIAVQSEGELSAEIARLAPEPPDGKVALFPICGSGKPMGVLYAQAGKNGLDIHALELLAGAAASTLERDSRLPEMTSVPLAPRAQSQPPAWFELSRTDQEKHVRAQRFARVRVAELLLYQPMAVKQGRAERNLYGCLRAELDAGRDGYQEEHLSSCPSMVDYYHLELVRTLANDDDTLLGRGYPGPLV